MEKQWCVYILQCADGTLYTGSTNDIVHRLKMHESGKGAKYTRGRGPLKLIYTENAESASQALQREYAIKQMTRQEKWNLIEKKTPEEL